MNKGSSTAAPPIGTIEFPDQQETSPPSKEIPTTGKRSAELKTPVDKTHSDSSPKRVRFADQSEEESEANTVSHYFAEGDEEEVV